MLIYILHPNCYYNFDFPLDKDGKYIISDYDHSFNERSLVNVAIVNGKAFINDNDEVKISHNNTSYSSVELVAGNFYTLSLISGENVVLYASLAYDNTFSQRIIDENSIIKIGNNNSDIVYYGVNNDQVEISYNGQFHIKSVNDKVPIYVNCSKKNDVNLNNFDVIFINGLKIVICKNSLYINNVANKVIINSKILKQPNSESYVIKNVDSGFNNFKDFYEENEYFFKSPVFQHKPDTLKINVSDPPSRDEKDTESVFMTTVPTFIMSLTSVITTTSSIRQYRNGQTDFSDLITELIMSGSILIGAILWPFIEKWARNLKISISNKNKQKKYIAYLKEKEQIFSKALKEQKISLAMNNPEIGECKEIIESKKSELFNRNVDNDNFLNLRLGKGKSKLDCNLDYQKQEYVLEKDPLVSKLEDLIDKYKYIDDSPYILSLKNRRICAFIADGDNAKDFMKNVILQLLTYHSYLDLKIVVLTSKMSELSVLKNINHCWDDERLVRYYAENVVEAQNVSSILSRELNQRKVKGDDNVAPYYLVISDCIDMYRNLGIIDDIILADSKYNFGLIMFDDKISDIPNKCNNFINISKQEGVFFQTDMSSSSIEHFKPEFIVDYGLNFDKLILEISNIPLKNNVNSSLVLPENYDFLEMFNIGNIEQLNVEQRWSNSNPYNSLATPLGIDVNGNILNLDLHEKNHGPHGLIAGTTGSGKSELIITFILSLAINYRPNEVQFVLIDYKGGGLASAFENRKTGLKLPHLIGTITNLDVSEMKRTLVSIKSELQRRQVLFNEAKNNLEAGNIDIYKYQKLYREEKVSEPLSHLFVICDEFAELKDQQPDFMDELVSAARIGRSLGIHLILATQKPSGVVDDQIWSNSKFKICCKVQTTDDSSEMLKKPDAAFIKEAGRFYLQVGNDEYFTKGQAAYTGNAYVPSETYNAKLDNSISFINNIGEVFKSVEKREDKKTFSKNLGDELTNILKYIVQLAKKLNIKNKQLWLDNIPSIIYQNTIVSKYSVSSRPYVINPVIGEFDDPKNQRQGPVLLDVTNNGNVYLVGMSGSGKTTFLSTFIYASIITHNCDELNIYIIDCGAERLRVFQNAPQVGEVLTVTDSQKIKNLLYMINAEMLKRQKFYASSGTDFISEANSGKASFNNLVIIINGIEAFKEVYEDIFDYQFGPITRNCNKYGISFIITSTMTNSLSYAVENNFPQKIMLNMVDLTEYSSFFNNSPIPNTNAGRGVIQLDEPYEFQTAISFDNANYAKNINYIFEQLNKFLLNHAQPIPVVPKTVSFDMIEKEITTLDSVPLGINEESAQIGYLKIKNMVTFISSENTNVIDRFIPNLVKILSMVQNVKFIIINAITDDKYGVTDNVKEYSSGFAKIISVLNQSLNKPLNDSNILVLIMGYGQLQNQLNEAKQDDANIITLDELIQNSVNNTGFKYLIYDSFENIDAVKSTKAFEYVGEGTGLWLGENFEYQDIFLLDGVSDEYKPTNNDVTVVDEDKISYIKFVK